MIELALTAESSIVQLSSNLGCTIEYEVSLTDLDVQPFDLVSGYKLSDCLISLSVYSEAITSKPWEDSDKANKFGELSATLAGNPQSGTPPVLGIRLFVYDYVFNMLITNHSQDKLPQGIWIGLDEDTFLKSDDSAARGRPQLMDSLPGVMKTEPSVIWYLFNTQKTS